MPGLGGGPPKYTAEADLLSTVFAHGCNLRR